MPREHAVQMKDVAFLGSSLDDLRAFPKPVTRALGFQLDRVQHGLDPVDWKAMPAIGPGARELRTRDPSGAYRVIYVAAWGDAVYVRHAFQKKTETTAKRDLDLAARRFAELRSGRG